MLLLNYYLIFLNIIINHLKTVSGYDKIYTDILSWYTHLKRVNVLIYNISLIYASVEHQLQVQETKTLCVVGDFNLEQTSHKPDVARKYGWTLWSESFIKMDERCVMKNWMSE